MTDYNQHMGFVDQFNQAFYLHFPMIRQNNVEAGLRRYLLRIGIVNAYRMYELFHNKKITQQIFSR